MATEWLQQLKPGDLVAVSGRKGEYRDRVVKVTPTQIVLSNNCRYRRATGVEIGSDVWTSAFLVEFTPEVAERIALRVARWRIKNTDADKLADDQVRRIYAILKEGDGNGKA